MMVPENSLTLGRELALLENWKAPVEGGWMHGKGSALPHRSQVIPGAPATGCWGGWKFNWV